MKPRAQLRRRLPCQEQGSRKSRLVAVYQLRAGLAQPDAVGSCRALMLAQLRIEAGTTRRRPGDVGRDADVHGPVGGRLGPASWPTAIGIRAVVPSPGGTAE